MFMQFVFKPVINICKTDLSHYSEIYVARKEDRRNAYRIVVGGNTLWIAEDTAGDNVIKIYLGKTSYEGGRLKELAQCRVQWRTLVLANFKLEFCWQTCN
jgi:hypothetical protein